MKNFLFLFLVFLFLSANSCITVFSQNKLKYKVNSHAIGAKIYNNIDKKEKVLKEYIWVSKNRSMEVYFVCNNDSQMGISIKDSDQMDFVKGYPAYIKMAVAYSPIIGSENDIRLTHIGGTFLKNKKVLKIKRKDIQQFLKNLHILHLQDIKNKKMIREEYDHSVSYCAGKPTEKEQNVCYKTIQPGRYMVSNYPVITLKIVSYVIPPKNARPVRFLAGFNSEQLFYNLKKLSCYENINK